MYTADRATWTYHPFTYNLMKYHLGTRIMSTIASQTTTLTSVYSTVYSGENQRKHQSSASLAFVRGIHRWPVNSPHKGPVTREMFPFDDVIMVKWIIIGYNHIPKHPLVLKPTTRESSVHTPCAVDKMCWWVPRALFIPTVFLIQTVRLYIQKSRQQLF